MASATSWTPLPSASDSGTTNSPNTCLIPNVTVTSAALAIRTRNQISGLVTPEEEDAMMGCCPDEVVLRGGFRICALHFIPRKTLVARPSKAKRFFVAIGTALSGCP